MLTPNLNQVSTFKGPACKTPARERIAAHTRAFLDKGKAITQVANGASGDKGGQTGIIINIKRDAGRTKPTHNGPRLNGSQQKNA